MIFVTLGTQDRPFNRLLDAIQKEIDNGNIKGKVIVQAGFTKFESDDMEIFDYALLSEFDELMKKCDVLITHGGVGSIITGLKNNKKIIAAARLKEYNEHTNDHQLQIIDSFEEAGYLLNLNNFDKLGELLEKIKAFEPKKFKSNTHGMVEMITSFIEKE